MGLVDPQLFQLGIDRCSKLLCILGHLFHQNLLLVPLEKCQMIIELKINSWTGLTASPIGPSSPLSPCGPGGPYKNDK